MAQRSCCPGTGTAGIEIIPGGNFFDPSREQNTNKLGPGLLSHQEQERCATDFRNETSFQKPLLKVQA